MGGMIFNKRSFERRFLAWHWKKQGNRRRHSDTAPCQLLPLVSRYESRRLLLRWTASWWALAKHVPAASHVYGHYQSPRRFPVSVVQPFDADGELQWIVQTVAAECASSSTTRQQITWRQFPSRSTYTYGPIGLINNGPASRGTLIAGSDGLP